MTLIIEFLWWESCIYENLRGRSGIEYRRVCTLRFNAMEQRKMSDFNETNGYYELSRFHISVYISFIYKIKIKSSILLWFQMMKSGN